MTTFEQLICCLLIPIEYVLIYIAGKYDFIGLVCRMLEEKTKELEAKKDDSDA